MTHANTIRTERLQLRPVRQDDLEALLELDSDPRVMLHISGGVPSSREDYELRLMPRMLAFEGKPYGYFAALHEGTFIGWFHLRPSVFESELLELGYRLQHASWGKGFATEGGQQLVRHAFDVLDAPAVDACCAPENVASARVMYKCGLREVAGSVHPRAGMEVRRFVLTRADYDTRSTP